MNTDEQTQDTIQAILEKYKTIVGVFKHEDNTPEGEIDFYALMYKLSGRIRSQIKELEESKALLIQLETEKPYNLAKLLKKHIW